MCTTLVVQSHRNPLPFDWLQACIDSVSGWAQANRFDYRFFNDEIFNLIDQALLDKTGEQTAIATDLARLKVLQQGLAEGFDRVVWCDADFLIFRPDDFVLSDAALAVGREIWVQRNENGKLQAYPKVHNAWLMFCRGNTFLDFYIDTATRLLRLNRGSMPPQFIGPKLLTALHNIVHFPVMESAGMLSPLVIRDLIAGQGKALQLFRERSPAALAGANLSSSLTEKEGFSETKMAGVIERLLTNGI